MTCCVVAPRVQSPATATSLQSLLPPLPRLQLESPLSCRQPLHARQPASAEAQRRAQSVLKKLSEPVLTPDRLRTLEVLELLEYLRRPKAVALLQELERDALIPQIRREARQAAQRATVVREEKK